MDTFMDKLAQKFTAQEMIKANSLAETEEMNRLKVQVEEYTGCLNRMKQICAEMEQAVESAKDKMDTAQLNTDDLRDQLLEIWQAMQNSANEAESDGAGNVLFAEQMEALRSELDMRIGSITENQMAQMESIRSLQTEQMESIRGMQQAQMDGIKGLQDAQVDGFKGLQDAQFENVRNSLEDQLDNMRSMMKAQISGVKNNQEGLRDALDKQNGTLEAQLNEMKENLQTQLSGSNEFVHRECVKVYRNVQAAMGEENSKQVEDLDYTLKPMSRRICNIQKISLAALVASLVSVLLQIMNMLNIV